MSNRFKAEQMFLHASWRDENGKLLCKINAITSAGVYYYVGVDANGSGGIENYMPKNSFMDVVGEWTTR